MTAETDLLPLPEWQGDFMTESEFREEAQAYARANLAELQREVATWKALHASEVQVRQRWQARAERLAEALWYAVEQVPELSTVPGITALLPPTAAQENDDA